MPEQLFLLTFEHAPIGIARVGVDGRFIRVNRALCATLGYPAERLMRISFQDITHPDDLQADLEWVQSLLDGERSTYSMEKRYVKADGEITWTRLHVTLQRSPAGAPLHFISMVEDINAEHARIDLIHRLNAELEARVAERTSALEASNARLAEMLLEDSLTGLYNRAGTLRHLEAGSQHARRNGLHYAVLFIDLDGFKDINDSHGHGAGDAVLRACGERLRQRLRRYDVIGRIGGDEFVVGIECANGPDDVLAIAGDLRSRLLAPVPVNESVNCHVDASIGIHLVPPDDPLPDLQDVLRRADAAMYAAKRHRAGIVDSRKLPDAPPRGEELQPSLL